MLALLPRGVGGVVTPLRCQRGHGGVLGDCQQTATVRCCRREHLVDAFSIFTDSLQGTLAATRCNLASAEFPLFRQRSSENRLSAGVEQCVHSVSYDPFGSV